MLWGGRFKKEKNPILKKIDNNLKIDKRLYREDIIGSIAHVEMLGNQKIIKKEEAEKIVKSLNEILQDIDNGKLIIDGDYEDIHSFIEDVLIKRIGDVAKKMHTCRSRNDQVNLDTKMHVKKSIDDVVYNLEYLIKVIDEKGNQNNYIMPGYTHMQRAQIITFKEYITSYKQMFKRDIKRLIKTREIMDESPLGSGAIFGTTLNIDREYTSKKLGFKDFQKNTIDSVSDRDYLIELLSDFSIIMMHISRFCEEMIIFSTKEFSFIKLSDEFSTGSSLMPQKKNPDSLELLRGKTGRVYGNLLGLLTVMKSLPLAYNKDMQEDKMYYFESLDTVNDSVIILASVIETMEVNKKKMEHETKYGFLNATELADYLVTKGIAFREAHKIAGKIILYCEENNIEIRDCDLKNLKAFSKLIEKDVYEYLSIDNILKMKKRTYIK